MASLHHRLKIFPSYVSASLRASDSRLHRPTDVEFVLEFYFFATMITKSYQNQHFMAMADDKVDKHYFRMLSEVQN